MPTQIAPFTKTPSRLNPATFSADMDSRLSEENTRIAQMNAQSIENNGYATTCQTKANEASASATSAASSALLAQGAANYQGLWTSKGYSVGQSVTYSDSTYVCNLTHTTAQMPPNETYWKLISVIDDTTPSLKSSYSGFKTQELHDLHTQLISDNTQLISDNTQLISDLQDEVNTAVNNSSVSQVMNSAPTKSTPINADEFSFLDSVAGAWSLVKLSFSQLKTALFASPTFTGTPTAPTASAGTNTTQVATTAFVNTAANLKAPINSPAFTGTPTAPTASTTTNNTQLATTAFVNSAPSTIKAWVNFNAIPLNGTYSQSGTTITVTMTAHGMSTGMIANLDFTSGTAVDGTDFVVTRTGANTFTVVGKTSATTSGNVTRNNYIRSAYNVSSVTDEGVGEYTLNFTNILNSADFSISGSGKADTGYVVHYFPSYTPNTSNLRIRLSTTDSLADSSIVNVMIISK
jgi:hypothetical protein